MADKYTIQVQPQVSQSDARKMEKDLNNRFANVSKKFASHLGKSVKGIIKGGLFAAGAAGMAALLTNPFDKTNEDLNNTLEKFDNTATRAAEFGVSSGKYFQAQSILESAGVKDFDTIITRFSTTLEKARPKNGKTEDPYLREFLGANDVIDAFYGFTATLKKMAPTERSAAVETVFGDKMGGKIAEVLQTDLSARRKQIFGSSSEKNITDQIDNLGKVEELQAIARQKLAVYELDQKSSSITAGTVQNQNEIERARVDLQSRQLSQYEFFAKISATQEKALAEVANISSSITGKILPVLEKGAGATKSLFDWFTKPKKMTKIKIFSD